MFANGNRVHIKSFTISKFNNINNYTEIFSNFTFEISNFITYFQLQGIHLYIQNVSYDHSRNSQ